MTIRAMTIRAMAIRAAVPACLLGLLLGACAEQPGSATKKADREYACVDVNGPIGTLILTGGGDALIREPAAAAGQPPNLFGRYEEQTGTIIIHNKDFGAITYRIEGEKLVSVAPEMSFVLVDRVTCARRR